MTIAIPPGRYDKIHPASAAFGTAEIKRHIARMFGDPLPAEIVHPLPAQVVDGLE